MSAGRLSLAMACLLLGSCSLFHPIGPNYQKPDIDEATGGLPTLEAAQSPAFSAALPPGPWWQLYQDPLLNSLVGEALAANRDLRAAASRLAESQDLLAQAKAAWLPTTSIDTSAQRARSMPYLPLPKHESNTFGSVLSVSYEIDLFGRIRRSIEAARASRDEQLYAYAAAEIQVAANTASAYVGACQANAQLTVAWRNMALSRQILAVTQRLARGGKADQTDVTRAQAELASVTASLPPLHAQKQSSLYALAVLLGRPPDRYPPAAAQCPAPPRLSQPLPAGDGLSLLRRRPDVGEAERALAAATAHIGVAKTELYPQVSFGLSAGNQGPDAKDMVRTSERVWSLGPLIHWSFPNLVAARAQLRQARASADAALSSYDSTVLGALKETETALNGYARELDHYRDLQAARDQDALALQQQRQLYQGGKTDFLNVLSAQQNLVAAEQQLVSSSGSIASDQVNVFMALGGGWDDAAQRSAEQAQTAALERRVHAETPH